MSFFDKWCGFFTGGITLVAGVSFITGGMVYRKVNSYVNDAFETLHNSKIAFHDVTVNVSMGTAPYMPMHIGMDTPTDHFLNNQTEEWLTDIGVSTSASFGYVSAGWMCLYLLLGMAFAGGMLYQQNQIKELTRRLDRFDRWMARHKFEVNDFESDDDAVRLTILAHSDNEESDSDDENRPLLRRQ